MQDGTYRLNSVQRDSGYQLGLTPYGESTKLSPERALSLLTALLDGQEIGVWTDDNGATHVEESVHVECGAESHRLAVETNQQAVWDWAESRSITILDENGKTAETRNNPNF